MFGCYSLLSFARSSINKRFDTFYEYFAGKSYNLSVHTYFTHFTIASLLTKATTSANSTPQQIIVYLCMQIVAIATHKVISTFKDRIEVFNISVTVALQLFVDTGISTLNAMLRQLGRIPMARQAWDYKE